MLFGAAGFVGITLRDGDAGVLVDRRELDRTVDAPDAAAPLARGLDFFAPPDELDCTGVVMAVEYDKDCILSSVLVIENTSEWFSNVVDARE